MRSTYAGKGMLTDAVINELTFHFGQNIRKYAANVDIDTTRKDIMSTYYHSSSTDANLEHQCCPIGADSLCWVHQVEAAGEVLTSHSTKDLCLYPLNEDQIDYTKCLDIDEDEEEVQQSSSEPSTPAVQLRPSKEQLKISLSTIYTLLGPEKRQILKQGQLLDNDDWHGMYKELVVQAAQQPDDEESCVSVNAGAGEDGTAGPNQSSVASANEAA
ncbi:hypothetical protein HAZT_HAZT006293 [Hyalella azteca]|uniref:Uncharacterized protein n=1 Tax=Hyalella azteca TaxID=294128 RepID=A0A6A0HGE4_HYAAZ|nr:hypothetical protein HAZT_HAZT006293 [Hyalella azteca]